MANSKMSKLLDLFTVSEPDIDDDLFDGEDEDTYEEPKIKKARSNRGTDDDKPSVASRFKNFTKSVAPSKSYDDAEEDDFDIDDEPYERKAKPAPKPVKKSSNSNKVLSINSSNKNYVRSSRSFEVYVIKPQDFNEAQSVTKLLKEGRAVVINMEGIEIGAAQRIIDFIGGACYALDGTLQAISVNIFIAAPSEVDVTGDLREEIINENTVSPELGRY